MHFVVGEGASSGPLLEAVLGTLLNAIGGPLPPPLGTQKFMKPRLKFGPEIGPLLDTAFEAIWTPPRRLLASILDQIGLDFGAPGASCYFLQK